MVFENNLKLFLFTVIKNNMFVKIIKIEYSNNIINASHFELFPMQTGN